MSKASTLLIRTPEGVVFSQTLAGPMSRCLALAIDMAIVMTLASLASAIMTLLSLVDPGFAQAMGLMLSFVVWIGYGIVCEWFWRGQTFGKRVLRLRVVDAEGLRLKFSQVVIRNLLRFADMLPAFYLVGGIACLLTRRAQRLGDIAANTIVVRIPKVSEPNLEQLMAGKFNSLRIYPHLEARLRQRVSPGEASLALQAILRRDLLEPNARVELFSAIAEHFRGKVPFPPEATEGITDEQYVRNIVDSLYRPNRAAARAARPETEAAPLATP